MKKNVLKGFGYAVTAFLLFLAIRYWPHVEGLLLSLLDGLGILAVGAVLAFIVDIPLSFYERKVFARLPKGRRGFSLAAAILSVFVVVLLVLMIVVPEFIASISLLADMLPSIESSIRSIAEDWGFSERFSAFADMFDDPLRNIAVAFGENFGDTFANAISFVGSTFDALVSGLMATVFAIYILLGKDWLSKGAFRLENAFLSPKHAQAFSHVASVAASIFRRFLVGQCLEAMILGLLSMLGMLLLGIPHAATIGSLIGVTALIPIAGAWIGAIIGAFMILPASPLKALVFLAFLLVLQQLEGNLIYPRVVGSTLGLKGIWVLAAIIVGGKLGGILGMLVAVPLFAVFLVLLDEHMERLEARKEPSAEARSPNPGAS